VITRIWRGWASVETADTIAADLRDGVVAAFAAARGNLSAEVLVRPLAGGIELLTVSTWDSPEAVPASVDERHELLVARQTVADCFEVAAVPARVAHAA
jgi:hypothetical protein